MDFDILKEQYINVNCDTSNYTKTHGLDSYEYLKEVPKEIRYQWTTETVHRKITELKTSSDITNAAIELTILLEKVKGQSRYEYAQNAVDTVLDKENFYFIDRRRINQTLDNLIDQKLRTILDDILL